MVRHLTVLCVAALFGISSIGCEPQETPVDEPETTTEIETDSNVTNGVETPMEEEQPIEE